MSKGHEIAIGRLAVARGHLDHRRALACYQEAQRRGVSWLELAVATGLMSAAQIAALERELASLPRGSEKALETPELPSEAATTQFGLGDASDPGGDGGGASAPPLLGDSIGGYELVAKLGEGGMGAVYRARRGDHEVALKVLLAGAEAEDILRFERESQASASVGEHPRVVRVHGAGIDGGWRFLIQQLIEGESLADELAADSSPWPWERALGLIAEVADGLDHIHEAGLVHRDLKPANIMLRADDGAPLITDFGIVKLWGERRLTATGYMLGTPAYMAPEQLHGDMIHSDTDLWSLGVILYELVCGRRPFASPSVIGLGQQIIDGEIDLPRRLVPELPEPVEALVMRGLARDRRRRFASAAAFAEACRATVAGRPSESMSAPRTRGARGDSRGSLVLIALLLCGLLSWFGRAREDPASRADVETLALGLAQERLESVRAQLGRALLVTARIPWSEELPAPTPAMLEEWRELRAAASRLTSPAQKRPRQLSALLVSLALLTDAGAEPEGRGGDGELAGANRLLVALRHDRARPASAVGALGDFGRALVRHLEGGFDDTEAILAELGDPGLASAGGVLREVNRGRRARAALFAPSRASSSVTRALGAFAQILETRHARPSAAARWWAWSDATEEAMKRSLEAGEGDAAREAYRRLADHIDALLSPAPEPRPRLPVRPGLLLALWELASRELDTHFSGWEGAFKLAARLAELRRYERRLGGVAPEQLPRTGALQKVGVLQKIAGLWLQTQAIVGGFGDREPRRRALELLVAFGRAGLVLRFGAGQLTTLQKSGELEVALRADPGSVALLLTSVHASVLQELKQGGFAEPRRRLDQALDDPRASTGQRARAYDLLASLEGKRFEAAAARLRALAALAGEANANAAAQLKQDELTSIKARVAWLEKALESLHFAPFEAHGRIINLETRLAVIGGSTWERVFDRAKLYEESAEAYEQAVAKKAYARGDRRWAPLELPDSELPTQMRNHRIAAVFSQAAALEELRSFEEAVATARRGLTLGAGSPILMKKLRALLMRDGLRAVLRQVSSHAANQRFEEAAATARRGLAAVAAEYSEEPLVRELGAALERVEQR